MLSKVKTLGFKGIEGFQIEVEVDVSAGLPSYNIVGLPDTGIKESRDRVISALRNSNYQIPNRKITINLAPAEIKKTGTHFDLPIAIGIILSLKKFENLKDISRIAFIGELSLDGKIKPVLGVLPMLISLKEKKLADIVIIPKENEKEAYISKSNYFIASDLNEVIAYITNKIEFKRNILNPLNKEINKNNFDFLEVKGQNMAKRAMEIAASGFHNIIMIGPPGSGKSMLAQRMPSILPSMSEEEALETIKIYSISGNVNEVLTYTRPFRSPHHSISDIALIGGGTNPKPGEISLSHNGVLFLDEFPEFSRLSIESLREPLENKKITISRIKDTISYPANFMLIAAANPCPCGYYGHPTIQCTCSPMQIQKYRNKISGPVIDRIDLHVQVLPVKYSQWINNYESESSEKIKNRVMEAIERQKFRNKGKLKYNSSLNHKEIKEFCSMPVEVSKMLENAMDKMGFSARSMDKISKIARTIADLDKSDKIKKEHVIEALQYRVLDKSVIN